LDRLILGPIHQSRATEVVLAHGLPEPILPERASRSRVVVLHSPGAAEIANRVAETARVVGVLSLADRDEAKTMTEVERLFDWLLGHDVGRHDTIVAVGGGAATDVAGFVAATWLRGIEYVAVPTTLLGAVDAAIGGKTGVNFAGKNLVGAFHLPSRVIIDFDILDALPEGLRLEGLAEALKAGYVGDPSLVELLQTTNPPLADIVRKAVAVKIEVVGSDYREGDRRAILNFGHTIGHAVELLAPMPHGLAVGVGMVAAGTISAARHGFDSRSLIDTVFALGLPVAAAGVTPGPTLDLVRKDKKRDSDGLRMVLLRRIGDPVVEIVSDDLLELGLAAVGIA